MIAKIIITLAIIAFGIKPDGKYVVLLQNNNELRATGGFMGSYAVFQHGLRISDIYTPDGQLAGHVEPPAPIQKAFQNGEWRLRDSNWDPDFTVAAPKISWFLEQGGEEKIDGIIAINFNFIRDWLSILGKVKTPDYPETVNAQNLYELAQKHAELGFFPGSTQKRDFLGSVGKTILVESQKASIVKKVQFISLVYKNLRQRQILVWLKNESNPFDGRLGTHFGNYFYLVESNLGANKANCCVTRRVIQEINGDQEKVTIIFKNDSQFENPLPPIFWGGNYIGYHRIIIPADAIITNPEKYDIEIRGQLKIVGFWLTVPAKQSKSVEIFYKLENKINLILVKRQPGIKLLPYKLIVDGKTLVDEEIESDRFFALSW